MVLVVERMKGDSRSTRHVGLSIVQQICEGESNNIVLKSGLRLLTITTPIFPSSSSSSSSVISDSTNYIDGDYCFLRSCHRCQNLLQPGKDVYMYRGDQGFCSIECRNKQIMVDNVKQKEAKTEKRVAISSMDCRGCETCTLLEELRQRRHQT